MAARRTNTLDLMHQTGPEAPKNSSNEGVAKVKRMQNGMIMRQNKQRYALRNELNK